MPGLWDQHGKGRPTGGALDDLFAVHHDPHMSSKDLFGGRLWCEVDQDANFTWKTYQHFLTNQNTCIKDASGFNKTVRDMAVIHTNHFGKGTAVLMNLSPQWYNAYRTEGAEAAAKRTTFMSPIHAAGVNRWVNIEGDNAFGYEITYWKQGDRTILFVCSNPEIAVSSAGGGNSVGLKTETIPVSLTFDKSVAGLRNERTNQDLGSGRTFKLDWKMNEALVLSFSATH